MNIRCARSTLSRFIVFLCDTSVWVQPRPKVLPGGVGCVFTVQKNERECWKVLNSLCWRVLNHVSSAIIISKAVNAIFWLVESSWLLVSAPFL